MQQPTPKAVRARAQRYALPFGLFASSPVFHALTGLSLRFTHLCGQHLPRKGKRGTARSFAKTLKRSADSW